MNHTMPITVDHEKDIAALPVFRDVEPAVLRDLTAGAHKVQHAKGTIFLAQGAPVTRFYITLEGWCGANKGNAEGHEALLQIFRHGDFLLESGPAALADTSPMNLQALTPVQILTLSPGAVQSAIQRSPAFAANMLAASVRRCQELRDHIEQLALHSAEERVGRFLLQMRIETDPSGSEIILPFDKSLIAAYLGIKPETLSRTLQSFKEKGFAIDRGRLTTPYRQALCDYCDASTMQSCAFAHGPECTNSAHSDTIVM